MSIQPQIISTSNSDPGTTSILADLNRQIAELSQAAANIPAGGVGAGQVASGVITATEIAAGTIVANNIAAGTITASLIASGAILSDAIASGAVTSDKINVSTLSAVAANMGTVTGGIFQTSTSGARVMMGSGLSTPSGVTSGIVGVDGSNNVTFTVDASNGNVSLKGALQQGSTGLGNLDGVTQNAVLQIVGGNTVANTSATLDTTQLSLVNATVTRDTSIFLTAPASFKAVTVDATPSSIGFLGTNPTTPHYIPVTVGGPISARAYVRSAQVRAFQIQVNWYNSSGTFISSSSGSTFAPPVNQWTRIYIENAIAPAGAAYCVPYVGMTTVAAGDTYWVDEMMCVPQPTATGSSVIAQSITGTEIQAGTITAANIAANAVTAGKIQAGAIDAMVITGARVQDTASDPKVAFDATGVYITNSSGTKLFTLDQTSGIILSAISGGAFGIGSISWHDTSVSGRDVGEVYSYAVNANWNIHRMMSIWNGNSALPTQLVLASDTGAPSNTGITFSIPMYGGGFGDLGYSLLMGDNTSSFLQHGFNNAKKSATGQTGVTFSASSSTTFDVQVPNANGSVQGIATAKSNIGIPLVCTYADNGNGIVTFTVSNTTGNPMTSASAVTWIVWGV